MPDSDSEFQHLFDPNPFRESGHQLIEVLARYLQDNLDGKGPVLDWLPPDEAKVSWQQPLPRQATLTPEALIAAIEQRVLGGSLHIHHPRNLGHQVAPPLPLAALCDLVAALTNQAMAIYETGPSATLIEHQVIQWLAALIGWPAAGGVLTSGGAQGNLTALLAARQRMADWDVWQTGLRQDRPLRILTSEHAHYSISRAAGIMGLGTKAVIPVAADASGRLSPSALAEAHAAARQRGERPFAVVAMAGCTPTGSIDPLRAIGEFCRAQKLWFHVDGAHGASLLLSDAQRAKLGGIELADSVVWDGHKLLYASAMVSAVLFRHAPSSFAAFAQEASYLFQGETLEDHAWNPSYRTLECTKRMMGLKLWAILSLYGTEKLSALIDQVCATARQLAAMLQAAPDFELLMPPQTNIVCFRHRPSELTDAAELDRHQAGLRTTLVQSGQFHLTQVRLHDAVWLRTTVMNPMTDTTDLDALLSALRTPWNH